LKCLEHMTRNAFLVYWCNEGLESVIPITEYEQWDAMNTFRALKNEKTLRNPLWTMLQHMTLRAKFNTQRHYELYAIECDTEISKEDLEAMFEQDPQSSADLIRSRGIQIYSDRVNSNVVKIV